MTATTTAPTVKDQELVSFGLVESASVNSIYDFTPSKLNEKGIIKEQNTEVFVNTFICHLIFYAFLCVSIFLHIFIDLGLGDVIKSNLVKLISLAKKVSYDKSPAFA